MNNNLLSYTFFLYTLSLITAGRIGYDYGNEASSSSNNQIRVGTKIGIEIDATRDGDEKDAGRFVTHFGYDDGNRVSSSSSAAGNEKEKVGIGIGIGSGAVEVEEDEDDSSIDSRVGNVDA